MDKLKPFGYNLRNITMEYVILHSVIGIIAIIGIIWTLIYDKRKANAKG